MTRIDTLVDALTEADKRLAAGDDPEDVQPLVRRALAAARRLDRGGDGDRSGDSTGIDGSVGRVVRDRSMDVGSQAGCKVEVGIGSLPASADGPRRDRIEEVIVEAADMLVTAFAEGGADTISVTLQGDDALVLEVGDKGTAFDPAEVGPADLELRRLRALVEPVDGQVVWESSWRHGTTLEVSVPAT